MKKMPSKPAARRPRAKSTRVAARTAAPAPAPTPAPAAPARTPTTLAPRGGRSVNGVTPSGFHIIGDHVTPEKYAEQMARPRFLNVIQASPAPCNTCAAHCCRARVIINVCDMVRLAAPLGMHPSSLCDVTETTSRNGEPVLIGDTYKHIILRHGEDDYCQLLLKVDGHRKCGVHAIRPQICRIYPFSYARGTMRYEMGHVICPTEWVLGDKLRQSVLDDIETHEQDRALDRKIVQAWNTSTPPDHRSAAAFWAYAMAEAGAALGVDVSYLAGDGQRTQLKEKLW